MAQGTLAHLRQMRRARGWSLGDLAKEVGGISRQMLHKYETSTVKPSPPVAKRIAAVFGIPVSALFRPLPAQISCRSVAYRHYRGLPVKAKNRIENQALLALQPRIAIRSVFAPETARLPRGIRIRSAEDIDSAAMALRTAWGLGTAPIAHLIASLEDRGVQVIALDAPARFDGTAIVISDSAGKRVGWAIVVRKDTCAERQRLSICHELGHLLLAPSDGRSREAAKEEERLAFAFATAFLAPAETVYRKVGRKRRRIRLEELLMLKRYFGISVQALLFRLRDLDIISDRTFDGWFMEISRRGWRKKEPNETPPEEPSWLKEAVLRLRAERVKSATELRHLFAHSPEREIVEAVLQQ